MVKFEAKIVENPSIFFWVSLYQIFLTKDQDLLALQIHLLPIIELGTLFWVTLFLSSDQWQGKRKAFVLLMLYKCRQNRQNKKDWEIKSFPFFWVKLEISQ